MIGTRPGTLQEPFGLPEKERFSREISELLVCVGKCQPIEVLGEPGTVEIEAREGPRAEGRGGAGLYRSLR